MKIGEKIKRIRIPKKLPQKEVISLANLDSAKYGRFENSKNDSTATTLEKTAKALGVSLSDLFASTEEFKEINSYDKFLMEK